MRILVAGDPRSIHTARFVGLLNELGHDVHVVAVELHYAAEEQLRDVTLHVPIRYAQGGERVRIVGPHGWMGGVFGTPLFGHLLTRLIYARAAPGRVGRARMLAQLAARLAPKLVISLKMQNEGYTVAQAREIGGWHAPWIHFSWGTDMEFFGKHAAHAPAHLPLIREVLARCDFHIADTHRDLRQAETLGFHGVTLGTMPANGGFDLSQLESLRRAGHARRDTILVKGRQGGYVGKALNVLRALRARPQMAHGFKVRLFMPTPDVAAAARTLRDELGLDCEPLPRLPYAELLGWYARSVIAVSATDVDGTPAFLLEAMAMGALPVHSDMVSVREWIEHDVNGLLYPVDDIDALADRMQQGLNRASLRDGAASRNWSLIQARADRARLRDQLAAWIEEAVPA